MTEFLVEFLPFLAAFYVAAGVAVVRPFQRVLTSALGRAFDWRGPGLTFLGLAPWREVVSVQAFPLAVAGGAVYRLDPSRSAEPTLFEPGDLEAVELEGLPPAKAETWRFRPWVMAGKKPVVGAATPAMAARFAAQLAAVQKAAPAERVERVRELLQESSDVEALRAVRASVRWHALALRVLCPLLMVVVFGLLPAIVYLPDLAPMRLERALRLWVVLHGWVVVVTGMMLVRGKVRGDEIAGLVSQMALFPPSAVRALGIATRAIYARFEPAAAAAALLDERALLVCARRELRRLEFSAERTGSVGLSAFFQARRKIWDRALRDAKTSSKDALAPPERVAGDATRYCPICSSEYRAGETCSDCRVPLAAFRGAA
ncbi:MAG TPA: hypothetical protein VFA20_04225 [Myxococcaceae bacterium]|nr:hypothetical protein [Myxococcaceae bacterium]